MSHESNNISELKSFLNNTKPKRWGERRNLISELISLTLETKFEDTERRSEIVALAKTLLLTDPLSGQQAGAVARYIRYGGYSHLLNFTLGDLIDLYSGDWQTVTRMCTTTKLQKDAWDQAVSEGIQGNGNITVYRGMKVDEYEMKNLLKDGIVPAGVWRNGSVDETIDRQMVKWLHGRDKDKYIKDSLLEMPFSRCNLLRDHWYVGLEWSVDSPDTLAISTSPKEGMDYARRHGNYLLSLNLPKARLIPRYQEEGVIDYSVLYYIEPRAIIKHEVKGKAQVR